jgi:hypothetical protein
MGSFDVLRPRQRRADGPQHWAVFNGIGGSGFAVDGPPSDARTGPDAYLTDRKTFLIDR